MHGLVLVDKDHNLLRSSIIWCDSRAVTHGDHAMNSLGEEPEFPVGFITGMIKYRQWIPFRAAQITKPGTLYILGLILIIITFIIHLSYKIQLKKGSTKIDLLPIRRIFLLLGSLVFILYPFIKYTFLPIYENAYQESQFFIVNTAIIGWVVRRVT